MTRQTRPLGLERLGSRILPSASPLSLPAHAAPAFLGPPVVRPHQALSGHGHGGYSYDPVQSGAGIEYRLHGEAHLSGMGRVGVSGSVHAVGFVSEGHAGGELTFADARGSVTVELTGPAQAGFSSLPGSFRFHVVREAGVYAGKKWADGTLTLALTPAPTAAGSDPHGVFSIGLHPSEGHHGGQASGVTFWSVDRGG